MSISTAPNRSTPQGITEINLVGIGEISGVRANGISDPYAGTRGTQQSASDETDTGTDTSAVHATGEHAGAARTAEQGAAFPRAPAKAI